MKKFISVFLIIMMILVMFVTGCSSKENPGESSNPSDSSGSVKPKTEKDTLTVALRGTVPTLDPHLSNGPESVNCLNPVYETLVKYDEDGKIIPLLAESWERIDDLSWKFNLRKGVKFHNGEEMKASDVVYSFKRATGPAGAPVSYIMNAFDPDGLEIVDDYTVIIRTLKPFSPIIGYLPYVGAVVISEKYFTESPEEAAKKPIGTGPFKFIEWQKNDSVTYVRNEEYWGEKPVYKNLVIKSIVESNSRIIELETGNVDIAYNIPIMDVERLKGNNDVKIETNNTTIFEMWGFNNEREPFNNVEFRKAIDLAIDEEGIVQAIHKGMASYTPGPVTPKMKYFDDSDTKCRYNPEEAKKILKELGISEGMNMDVIIYDEKEKIDLATIIQNQLRQVGINLEIKVLEDATFYDVRSSGDMDSYITGWGSVGFPEPDNNLYGPLHSSLIGSNNYVRYSNPELDKLLDSSRQISDGPEREKIIKDIQKIIRAEVPYITFANPLQIAGTRATVKGFKPTPAESHFVDKVYFE